MTRKLNTQESDTLIRIEATLEEIEYSLNDRTAKKLSINEKVAIEKIIEALSEVAVE